MGEVEEEEQPSRHDMPAFPSGKAEGEGRGMLATLGANMPRFVNRMALARSKRRFRGASASSWAEAKSAHCPARANKSSRLI